MISLQILLSSHAVAEDDTESLEHPKPAPRQQIDVYHHWPTEPPPYPIKILIVSPPSPPAFVTVVPGPPKEKENIMPLPVQTFDLTDIQTDDYRWGQVLDAAGNPPVDASGNPITFTFSAVTVASSDEAVAAVTVDADGGGVTATAAGAVGTTAVGGTILATGSDGSSTTCAFSFNLVVGTSAPAEVEVVAGTPT